MPLKAVATTHGIAQTGDTDLQVSRPSAQWDRQRSKGERCPSQGPDEHQRTVWRSVPVISRQTGTLLVMIPTAAPISGSC